MFLFYLFIYLFIYFILFIYFFFFAVKVFHQLPRNQTSNGNLPRVILIPLGWDEYTHIKMAQSAAAVEYTECISAEE